MTQENKELLLKDLCARLPYGVKIKLIRWDIDEGMYINTTLEPDDIERLLNVEEDDTEIKPYLFPLSSMTEKQLYELKEATDFKYNDNTLELVEWTETHRTLEFWLEEVPQYKVIEIFDWLNKNHFDYRCLIEKGLAIDATGLNIY